LLPPLDDWFSSEEEEEEKERGRRVEVKPWVIQEDTD